MKPKRKSPEKKAAAESRPRRSRASTRPEEAGATPLNVPRKSRRKVTVTVPPILLEGDRPPAPVLGGPGQRYVLGPSAPVEQYEAEGELPQAYGTQRLLLAARDPHWLYAHWDLNREQQLKYNSLSADKHLVLRIKIKAPELVPVAEIHVHPESRHWFVHVDQ